MLRRTALILLELVAGLLLVVVLAGGYMAFRLTQQGPIAVDFVTPYLAQALSRDGPLRLEVARTELAWVGFGTPIDIRVKGVEAHGASGALLATVPEMRLGLSVPALLRGRVAPTRIDLVEPSLYAERTAEGGFRLDIGDDSSDPEAGARILADLIDQMRRPPDPEATMGALRDLRITRGMLVVANLATQTKWQVPRLDMRLRRDVRGVRGTASADIDMGAEINQVSAEIVWRADDGGVTLRSEMADIVPAEFAEIAPVLHPLRALDVTLAGTVMLELKSDLTPVSLVLGLTGGKGTLSLPDQLPEPLNFDRVELHGTLDDAGRHLELTRFNLDMTGPADLTITGSAQQRDRTMELALTTELTGLPMEDLHRYWPKGVKQNTRDWMVNNLADGTFERTVFRLEGSGPVDDIDQFHVARMQGDLVLSGFTVHYRKPLPPVTNVSATATFDGKNFDIAVQDGALLDMKAGPGMIRILGLDTDDEHRIDIRVGLEGPLSSALAVLDHPPLGYAAKVNLVPERVSGHAKAELHFAFPLVAALTMDMVELDGKATLTEVAVPDIVSDIDATEGVLELVVTGHDLHMTGTALLNGVPSQVEWLENFPADAPIGTQVRVRGKLDDEQRRRFRLDFPDWLNGPAGVDLVYTSERTPQGRQQTIQADIDITPSTLRVDVMKWRKEPGKPGQGRVTVRFKDGKPILIPAFVVTTEELTAVGSMTLRETDYGLSHLLLDQFKLGESDARVDIRDTDGKGGLAIDVRGESFDVRPFRSREKGPDGKIIHPDPAIEAAPKTPLSISFDLGRAIMGDDGREIRQAKGRMERDSSIWYRTDLDAVVGESGTLKVRYAPDPSDARILTLHVETDDAGATLRGLDVISQIRGGQLTLSGRSQPDDQGQALVGRADLINYQVQDAPVLARLLSATSPRGFANLMSGQPIAFSRLSGDWLWHKDGITLREMRTSGSQVGLTLEGNIDLKRNDVALQGTIVPFTTVNKLLGIIPVFGDLLVGGEGQGLFAATYSVKGPTDNLDVGVNPLAVLAPGFLRNLFFLPQPAGEDMPKDTQDGK
ncbi:hypothetical protein CHU95_17400 [Niveispirillum lacus]|uniref:YhdP central domain-containing protein n=1 Tax=Niveispirillum lacus TaxID=1981099 RepID=A0A255YTL0_9PROT|nr:DUF3971 domain-containing protein [Niveispirillum lacus]OYQ32558.1 hypothetical protein CHU95_17400 [Niveispirillum lacus]